MLLFVSTFLQMFLKASSRGKGGRRQCFPPVLYCSSQTLSLPVSLQECCRGARAWFCEEPKLGEGKAITWDHIAQGQNWGSVLLLCKIDHNLETRLSTVGQIISRYVCYIPRS